MKKLFAIILTLLLVMLALASCNGGGSSEGGGAEGDGSGNEGGGNADGGNTDVDYGDATVILPGDDIDIIVADTKAMSLMSGFSEELGKLTGVNVEVYNSFAAERDREITFGYLEDRPLSVKAYAVLERMDRGSYFDGRYVIYAEGGDIAVAYDANDVSSLSALTYALDFLLEDATDGKGYMAYAKGIATMDTVDLIAEQEKIDEVLLTEKWEALRAVAGDEITDALKTYYTLYTDNMLLWLANLYAPGKMDAAGGNWVGGFYGAPSGRDTDGFGPDITCTRQVLGLLESTGMLDQLGGDYGLVLPKQIKEDIIYMVKSLQDKNGYFYHPQYTKEMMEARGDTQRRGRDLSAAITLLSKLGARPTYTTPTGVGGDGIDADGNYVGLALTSPLESTTAGAVSAALAASKVVATATDEYISSHANFAEYLAKININGNSYSVGNTLSAVTSQIRAASSKLGASTDTSAPYYGKTLVDMLIEFLDSHIDATTGMWENTTKFAATNGFMKCISVYNECKREFPMPALALNGLFGGLLGDQVSKGNICDVYNIWVGVAGLRSNVLNYSSLTGDEKAAIIKTIDDTFAEKGAEAILNSYKKYLPYRYDDGSFSDNVGSAAANLNGLPAGLGLAEGDTNATAIATAVVGQIYSSLGLSKYKVPLYTESDWMRFCETIMDLGPVIKYSYVNDDIVETFNDSDAGSFEYNESTTFTPNGVSSATIELDGSNRYLKFVKTAKNNSGIVSVKGTRAMSASANTATATVRMKVESSNNQRIRINLSHYNESSALQSFDLTVTGDKIYFIDTNKVYTGAKVGEWFELKLVYFEGDANNSFFIRLYVNDVLIAEKTTVKNTAYAAQDIGCVRFVPLYDWLGTMLIDEVSIVRAKVTHDMNAAPTPPSENENPDTGGGEGGETPDNPGGGTDTPDTPEVPETPTVDAGITESFESFAEGAFVNGDYTTFVDNGVSTAEIVVDGENKYLKFDKTGKNNSGILTVKGDYTKASADTATVTMKLNFTRFTTGNFKINLTHYNGESLLQSFLFKADGTHLYYVGESGDAYTGAEVGDWFELKFVYFQGNDTDSYFIRVYVGDKLIGVKTTVSSKAYNAAEIGAIKFVPLYGWLGTVLVDDMTIFRDTQTHDMTLAPEVIPLPEVPTDPENPDTGEGEGTETPDTPSTGDGTETPDNPGTGDGTDDETETPDTGEVL